MKIKDKDYDILDRLLINSRVSAKDVSDVVKVPINTIYDRIKRMECANIVRKYVTVIRPYFFRHNFEVLFLVSGIDSSDLKGYEVNSVIAVMGGLFLVEAFFLNLYHFRDFRSSLGKSAKVLKTFYIRETVRKHGFSFS